MFGRRRRYHRDREGLLARIHGAILTGYAQVIKYPRVPLLDYPEFEVSTQLIQPAPGVLMTFVHVDVFCVTASTIKLLLKLWPAARATLPPIIYCSGHVDDDKFHRFVTLLGGTPLSHTHCSDGQSRRIYVNYLQRDNDGRRS